MAQSLQDGDIAITAHIYIQSEHFIKLMMK